MLHRERRVHGLRGSAGPGRHCSLRPHALRGAAAVPWKLSQHWNNNLIVEGDGREARALCYIVTIGTLKDGGGSRLKVQGAYDDELEKQGGQWLFRRRTTRFDELTPERIPARG